MLLKNLFKNTLYVIKYLSIIYIVTILVFGFQEILPIINDDASFSLVLIISIFIYYLLLKRENKEVLSYLKIKKFKFTPKLIILLMCFSVCCFIFKVSLSEYLVKIYPDQTADSPINIFLILQAVFLAPVCEEILYRGIIFSKIKNFMGIYSALIVQAILFGLAHGFMHGHQTQSILAALSGLIYALIYLKMNNLIIPIILHSFNNLFCVVLELTSNDNIFIYNPLISLVLSCLSLIILYKLIICSTKHIRKFNKQKL